MKNLKISLIFGLFSLVLIGCAPYEEVSDTIYLQSASVKTTVFNMPVFLTTDQTSTLILRPHVQAGQTKTASGSLGEHTKVNESGNYQIDTLSDGFRETANVNRYSYKEDNFQVTTNDLNVGLDADLFISKNLGLTAGIGFSDVDHQSMQNYRVGIAIRSFEKATGIRLDAGISWQETKYDIRSVISRTYKEWFSGTTQSRVYFTHDTELQKNLAWYLNFSMTMKSPESFIGGFINAGYVNQQILDFQPYNFDDEYYQAAWFPWYQGSYYQADLRNEYSASFVNFSGGVLFTLTPVVQLAGGAKIYTEISGTPIMKPSVYPFVQLHFGI